VVFDECGKSRDFAHGLIASAREFLGSIRAKTVVLILCGAGLEDIHIAENGNKKCTGSDPTLSTVLIIRETNLELLPDKLLREAIKQGTYSRTLATNARMLTQGVIPVLTSSIVVKRIEDPTVLKQSQIEFGSFRYAMNYCSREYAHLNGLGGLEPPAKMDCMRRSFQFMERSALLEVVGYQRSTIPRHATAMRLLKDLGQEPSFETGELDDDSIVFTIGLATRDLKKTSSALKYLACHGKTGPAIASNGVAFELIVSAHFERHRECLGYSVGYYELRSAWPPATEKKPKLDVDDINERIAEMKEEGKADVSVIAEFLQGYMNTSKKSALVVRQGVPNAQGADVMEFVLKKEPHPPVPVLHPVQAPVVLPVGHPAQAPVEAQDGEWTLEMSLVQAKNWNGVRYRSAMNEAARSIGVAVESESQSNATPLDGSAGYSYQAAIGLLNEVGEKLGIANRMIKRRVIAVAYHHKERSLTDFTDIADNVELWSREMLEPTISALPVADDEDGEEGQGEDAIN
jgi:hypothetical protein